MSDFSSIWNTKPPTKQTKTYEPFYSILAWMSNHIQYEVWNEIIHTFPNFNGATIWIWFNSTLYWSRDYLYMLGLKLIRISTWGQYKWYLNSGEFAI